MKDPYREAAEAVGRPWHPDARYTPTPREFAAWAIRAFGKLLLWGGVLYVLWREGPFTVGP